MHLQTFCTYNISKLENLLGKIDIYVQKIHNPNTALFQGIQTQDLLPVI